MKKVLLVSAVLSTIMVGCGEEASRDNVQLNYAIAKENAYVNALQFTQDDPRFAGWKLVKNTDSTISSDCPQGDGWATLLVVSPDNVNKSFKVKCSTHSKELGCFLEDDFNKKPFRNDDGSCQPVTKVPNPLPKIQN